jgi:hypothetical protein
MPTVVDKFSDRTFALHERYRDRFVTMPILDDTGG